jgi:4-amino-4-deoxy-L-arabinose transferase-like glycosyltransferase
MKFLPLWLFAFALGVRLLLIAVLGLDGLYGQDAFAYIGCAREILQMHWGQTACGDFYWPLGYPALAALFMLGTHAVPFGAQLASAVTGAAIAPLTYWLVVESGFSGTTRQQETSIAFTAGLITALCGMLMMSSILVMSDAAGLFWATLSACSVLRWERRAGNVRSQLLWLSLAAFALALAIITRWIYGGLLLPFGAFVVIAYLRDLRGAPARGVAFTQGFFLTALGPAVLAATVFLLILVPQLYINQHSGAPVMSHGWVVNWSPLNALHASFDNPDGHFDYRVPPIIFYAAPFYHPIYLCPLLTAAVLFGAWQLRRSPVLILLGGWIATLYLYLIGIPYENIRFGLAFFVPVAVLAGVGIFRMPLPVRLHPRANAASAACSVGPAPVNTDSRWRWLLLAVSLVLAMPFTYRMFASFRSSTALEIAATRYLKAQVPADATVVTFELSISLEYYTHFKIVELFEQSPQSLRPVVCGNRSVYLYVEKEKLESQWVGRPPQENFHWLRDHIGLEPAGLQGTWTLYRVRPCR